MQTASVQQKLTVQDLWKAVLAELQLELSEYYFKTWIELTAAENLTDDTLDVVCPSVYIRDRIQQRYLTSIQESVNRISGKHYDINFLIKGKRGNNEPKDQGPLFQPEGSSSTAITQPQLITKPVRENQGPNSLNEEYTFERYVMGSNNQLAFSIATAIAEKPGVLYNPLFLYSGVGLGKTHLMQAVGNRILQKNPKTKVLYVTGEKFTNELIEGLQGGRKSGKYSSNQFREKYRTADVLLIDDIQFIVGKEATQEEFFHTFSAYLMGKKQIVITSDRAPRDFLNIEERIRSRFSSGIIADIQAPNIETRIAILRNKRDRNHDNMPDEVINLIAESINTNIRELEGAYLQVVTFAKATGASVSIETALNVLGQNGHSPNRKKPVTHTKIIKAVCNYYNVKPEDIKGKRRTKTQVLPRQITMYLLGEMLNESYMGIGEFLGGRDHSTIIHGIRKIEGSLEYGSPIHQDITNLRNIILKD